MGMLQTIPVHPSTLHLEIEAKTEKHSNAPHPLYENRTRCEFRIRWSTTSIDSICIEGLAHAVNYAVNRRTPYSFWIHYRRKAPRW